MTLVVSGLGTSALGLGKPPEIESGAPTLPSLVPVKAINTKAKDFSVDESTFGLPFNATTVTRQKVLLRVGTRKGSIATLPDFGDDSFNIDRTTDDFENRIVAYTKAALKDLTDAKEVALESVEVRVYPGGFIRRVNWIDLSSKKKFSEQI